MAGDLPEPRRSWSVAFQEVFVIGIVNTIMYAIVALFFTVTFILLRVWFHHFVADLVYFVSVFLFLALTDVALRRYGK